MPPILYGKKLNYSSNVSPIPTDSQPEEEKKQIPVYSANGKLPPKAEGPMEETSTGQDVGEAVGNAAWQTVTLGAANLFGAGDWGAKAGKEVGGWIGGEEEETAAAKYNESRREVGEESEKNASLRPGVIAMRNLDNAFKNQKRINDYHGMKKLVYGIDLDSLV